MRPRGPKESSYLILFSTCVLRIALTFQVWGGVFFVYIFVYCFIESSLNFLVQFFSLFFFLFWVL